MNAKELVTIRTTFEWSTVGFGTHGLCNLVKIGNIDVNPVWIWNKYLDNPRKIYPPLNVVSREQTKLTSIAIINVIKNSSKFNSIIQIHLGSTFPTKRKRLNYRSESEAPSSENNEENIIAHRIKSYNIYKAGLTYNKTTSPIISMFNTPSDNMLNLYHLHYEIIKLMQ